MFAFVQTTDPEVLLVIESRPSGGELAWHYGLARMSMVNLRTPEHKARGLEGAEWKTRPASTTGRPTSPSTTPSGVQAEQI